MWCDYGAIFIANLLLNVVVNNFFFKSVNNISEDSTEDRDKSLPGYFLTKIVLITNRHVPFDTDSPLVATRSRCGVIFNDIANFQQIVTVTEFRKSSSI